MFRVLGKNNNLNDSNSIVDDSVNSAATTVINAVTEVVTEYYDDAYPAPLFKNVKKCTDILAKCGF